MSAHTEKAHDTRKPLWPIFLIGLAMFAVFLLASQYLLSSNPTPDQEAERAGLRAKNLEELNKGNEAKLNHYGWVDKTKGVVQIPIKRAIELTVPALNQNTPHAAYPVIPPVAAAAPSPAQTQASPAPSAAAQSSPAH
ncbi:MAG: hypothetical protein ABI615_00875 [Chthoniobacterales bacterium]